MLSTTLAERRAQQCLPRGMIRLNCVFLHRVRISKLHILDVTFQVTPDGKGFNVRISITAEVTVTL